MPLPKRILVVVDPTAEAQPAVQRAALIARKTNAQVELFICAYDPLLSDTRWVDATRAAKARAAYLENELRRLHALARPLTDDGIAVTTNAAWDSPRHEGIVRKALASNADLVVKDTHYHTALRRSIFSNTDWNLIRECPVPLWLVKQRQMRSQPCFVAAIDPVHERDKPAELDHEIVSIGAELSAALGGRLELFHAFDVGPALAAMPEAMSAPLVLPVPELVDAVRARHEDAVYALTDRHGIARDRVHLEQGETRDRLLVLTGHLDADVVVMGAVSRRGLARVFIGNTAEAVLDRLGCDLLIVKPQAVAAALRARAGASDPSATRNRPEPLG
jgi:universal stress protein E